MPEFDYFNGENFITFDLIEIDDEKREVTVAASDTGRISVKTFDLLFDGNRRYFEYGCLYTKIYIDEFTEENNIVRVIGIFVYSYCGIQLVYNRFFPCFSEF